MRIRDLSSDVCSSDLYDSCEDADSNAPSCSAAKGRVVYALNALDGSLIRTFDLSDISGSRRVAADVSMVDVDSDGLGAYAYAADNGGAMYRMAFINGPAPRVDLAPAGWSAVKRV